ncbi:MAG: hypothetical protein IJJ38_00025 [Lachnospiraceae bacterium]|nr:hypothetical protein [Lachnospiraceae bacterium]
MKVNPKNASVFRLLVAAYLIYLGGSNLMHLEATEHRALIIVFSVLFVVVGAAYGLMTFRMMKQYKDEEEEEPETAAPEEEGAISEEERASLEEGIISEEEVISPDGEDRAE